MGFHAINTCRQCLDQTQWDEAELSSSPDPTTWATERDPWIDHRWGFPGTGVPPIAGWFRRVNHSKSIYKWMIWGYPYFRKPPDAMLIFHPVFQADPLNHGISWLETLKSQRKTSSTKEDHSPLNQEIDMGMGWKASNLATSYGIMLVSPIPVWDIS